MKKKCATKFCRNKVDKAKYCGTCRSRMSRERDPVRYAYNNLKSSARKRGIEFTLTIDQFREFCYKTEYIAGKGRSGDSYSIDRIHNDRGYTIDNIRVLTVSENSRKNCKQLFYDWLTGYAKVFKFKKQEIENYF